MQINFTGWAYSGMNIPQAAIPQYARYRLTPFSATSRDILTMDEANMCIQYTSGMVLSCRNSEPNSWSVAVAVECSTRTR